LSRDHKNTEVIGQPNDRGKLKRKEGVKGLVKKRFKLPCWVDYQSCKGQSMPFASFDKQKPRDENRLCQIVHCSPLAIGVGKTNFLLASKSHHLL